MSQSLRIIKFTAQDILRLSVVEITPDGNVVTLTGENGAGKSSVLNAIQMTIAGRKAAPERPIREGADKGQTELTIGAGGKPKFIIERKISQGRDTMTVRAPGEAPVSSPQTLLNELYASTAFDPMSFSRMDAEDQIETLRKMLPELDLSKLDAAVAEEEAKRTEVGREGKSLKARLDAAPAHHPDAPAAETSVAELAAEAERRRATVRARDDRRRLADQAVADRRLMSEGLRKAADEVDRLKRLLDDAIGVHGRAVSALNKAGDEEARLEADAQAAVVEDPAPIEEQLKTIDITNRAVRENAARAALEAEYSAAKGRYEKHTDNIKKIEERKLQKIAAVKMPVPGIEIRGKSLLFNKVPFKQASDAEKIRVSVAIAAAQNPQLRVIFVRDASLLTEKNLAILASVADEMDLQLWIEDARSSNPAALVLEDGQIAGTLGEIQARQAELDKHADNDE